MEDDDNSRDAGPLADHRALLAMLGSTQAAAHALVYMAADNMVASGHIIKGTTEAFVSDLMGGFAMRYHLGRAGMWPVATATQALLAGYTFKYTL
eukprot:2656754-Amphidinium_carterae.1